jgi:hypothetical protein
VTWPAPGQPLFLAAQLHNCKLTPQRFWIPLRLTPPTVAPGLFPEALRFVSLVPHILQHKGRRHRRNVSARNVSEPTLIRKRVSLKLCYGFVAHTAAQNTQHTASLDELAEPNYYSNYLQTSSTGDFASHFTDGFAPESKTKFPARQRLLRRKSRRSLLIPASASRLQVFQFFRGPACVYF